MKWDGGLISKPGVYDGLPIERYHQQPCVGPSISSSGLRTLFTKSPKHYYDTSPLNPDRADKKETAAFVLGRAAHHLLLGEDDFSTLFIARPEDYMGKPWHGNRNDCKAWLAVQEAEGRTVLTPDQIEQIRGMARELADDPLIQSGILNGEIEQTLVVQDEKTGVYLLSRPDSIPNDSGDFADLKSTSDSGDELDRAVSTYRYDMQGALVKFCYEKIFKRQMMSFSLVFVESKRPHCVDTLTLASEDIELAEQDLRVALDTFGWCLKTGNWFGPSGHQRDARFVHISDWAKKNAEYRRDLLRREIETKGDDNGD